RVSPPRRVRQARRVRRPVPAEGQGGLRRGKAAYELVGGHRGLEANPHRGGAGRPQVRRSQAPRDGGVTRSSPSKGEGRGGDAVVSDRPAGGPRAVML